jgi:hypothetical protein
MLLHALTCTLADTASSGLPAPDSPAAIGWLLAGLAALSVAMNQVTSGIVNIRKLKGIDPGSDDRYATKDEHQSTKDRIAAAETEMASKAEHQATKDRLTTVEAKQEALQLTLSNELSAIHRALGRIEGHLSAQDHKG